MPALPDYTEPVADEVQEMINYRPHWIIRKGNFIFLLILLLLLGLARMIQYPDKIKTNSRLISPGPVEIISATTGGRLAKLLVQNEQEVKKDQVLGYIKNDTGTFNGSGQSVLLSPGDGKLMFVSSLQQDQRIAQSQELFYIQPSQNNFYAEAITSQQRLGKIRIGQQVIVKVESYPFNEFGYLVGSVDYIPVSADPQGNFEIRIGLPNGLQTNYGKTLFFRNGLLASAEIITDNRSLFDRLMGQFKEIIK